ncbi:hypothetical protein GBA52_011750 [Prunus armeniaca]|nr:hypothetical protein GBA52_011750 [Prunus armeniaca]
MGCRNTILLVLVFVGLITKKGFAAQLTVGGSQVFKYSSGLHSVVELPNESAYKSCDLGGALDSKNTGSDVVKLTKAGTRYFACGTLGHCGQGMKVKITTVDGNAPSSPASASSSSPSSDASPASTSLHSITSFLVLAALSANRCSAFYVLNFV